MKNYNNIYSIVLKKVEVLEKVDLNMPNQLAGLDKKVKGN